MATDGKSDIQGFGKDLAESGKGSAGFGKDLVESGIGSADSEKGSVWIGDGPAIFENSSALRGLQPLRGGRRGHSKKFVLSISESGEPILSCNDRGSVEPLTELPPEDSRLVEVMRHIDNNGFGINWGRSGDRSLKVSLWKAPNIVDMMRGCQSVKNDRGEPLTFSDEPVSMVLRLMRDKDGNLITPTLIVRLAEEEITNPVFLAPDYLLVGGMIYKIASVGINFSRIANLLSPIAYRHLESYLSIFASCFDNITPELDGMSARYISSPEHTTPTLILQKVAPDKALYLLVTSTIDSLTVSPDMTFELTKSASITEKGQILIRPVETSDVKGNAENLHKMLLGSAPNRQARKDIYRENNFFIVPAETAGPFLLKHLVDVLREFKLLGSEKLREYQVTAASPKLNVRLSSGIDFLEGDAQVSIGDESFTIGDFLARFAKNRYITLSDGNRAIVDEKYINRLKRLFGNAGKDGRIKVTLFDLPEVEEMIQSKVKGEFASHTREVYEGFNKLKKKKTGKYDVKATLRPYQIEGVKWIKYLYDNNLGGCLADDMGLGKTLQTIAVLTMTRDSAGQAPALIVMPRSLLFNWEKELQRFAPQLSVSTYYGPGRQLQPMMHSDVILTTYATVRNDIELLKGETFDYVILDESQNIKNVASQTSNAMMLLDARHRLALSGTPMENNLTEIYSLFRFLNPTMFGDLESYNSAYTYPIQHDGDKDATDSLRRRIFPFMLRRLKKEVLQDLPDRIDQTIYVEMSPRQKTLYDERRLYYRQQIHDTIAREGVGRSQFVMFQALSELRRIASVPESLSDGLIDSPKIDELLESLRSAIENGHKAVVFFNFLAGIELVSERLEKMGIEFDTMTGSTTTAQRKKIVARFQTSPECKVLLMTLKVGGVGLNLTAADTVYIMEPWWNKAAEEQAINRLHRIGQKATVNTFTVITVGTIEEKIIQLQEQKAELFDRLISSDTASSKQLSEEDIDFILS